MFYEDDEIKITSELPNAIGYGLQEINMFGIDGSTKTNTGMKRLVQSMRNILETPIGTRFMLPAFGSKLYQLVFEQNDFILKDLAKIYVKDAIGLWEPRVVIDDVVVDTDSTSEVCQINIYFHAKDSADLKSFVYSLNRQVPELR